MKRVLSIALCLFLLLSCAVPTLAANDVPEEVMEATKSVVRILSQYYNGAATGSGFVIKNEPGEVLIATNNHVVEGNPTSISVWVAEDELVEAEIVFTTAKKDLCVLRLADMVEMQPLTLSKEDARQGQAVYAVGYPGVGDILSDSVAHTSEAATITDGIISAIRTFTIEEGAAPTKLLQINAAINPGNSGGPLFNAKGEVIGVNTYKVNKDSQGIFGAVDISELWTLLRRNGVEIPEKEAEPETEPEPVAVKKPFPVGIAVGAAGALVLLVVVIILILSSRKKPKRKNHKQKTEQTVTLREYLQNYPQGLGIGGAVSLLLPAGIALRNYHNDGKLHLEICPENILVGSDGASLKNPSGQEAGRFHFGFSAPEIYKGAGYGSTSDIYSFGAVLYFAATGKVPAYSLQQDVLEEDFYGLENAAFAQVLRKCMAANVQDRTQSMQELIYGIAVFNVPEEAPKAAAPVMEEVPTPVTEAPVVIPVAEKEELPPPENNVIANPSAEWCDNPPRQKERRKLLLPIGVALACVAVAAVVLLWNLVISPNLEYNSAVKMMEAGQYEEAIAAFEALDGFKDSVQRIENCEIGILELQYEAAVSLMNQGKYEEAKAAFEALEGYRDSTEKVEETVRMADYAAAEDLLANGDRYGAATAFYALGDYRDAWSRCFEIWGTITQRETVSIHKGSVALKNDGTVLIGSNNDGVLDDAYGWTDIAAVSGGYRYVLGLKSDGTVVAAGNNDYGQCDVSGWTDIVAISTEDYNTVGIKADGTVVVTGRYAQTQSEMSFWTDIVAVSTAGYYTLALRADGTVVDSGSPGSWERKEISDWKDIVTIAAGTWHAIGLKSDGTVVATGQNSKNQCNTSGWTDIVAISVGLGHTVGLKSDGTVVAAGNNKDYFGNYSGHCKVSNWSDIVAIVADASLTVGLKSDGTLVQAGRYPSSEMSFWTDIKLPN